jgi:hypothetical protein
MALINALAPNLQIPCSRREQGIKFPASLKKFPATAEQGICPKNAPNQKAFSRQHLPKLLKIRKFPCRFPA